jgi:hypothetical protein
VQDFSCNPSRRWRASNPLDRGSTTEGGYAFRVTIATQPAAFVQRRPVARGWVRSAPWDGAFLLSGLWLTPIVWWLAHGNADPSIGPVDTLYLVLTALFWIGHRLSSTYLAYCTSAYRPLLSTQRLRFVWTPIAIALLALAVVVPAGFWPWSRAERVMALVIVDFGLITYHFASQHYGVLSLYRIRAGQPRDRGNVRADRLFALGVGGLLVFLVDAMVGTRFYQDVWLHPWIAPARLSESLSVLRVIGTGIVLATTLALLRREWVGPAPSVARALYLASVSVLALSGLWLHPFLFVGLWTVQHWLAAVGIATVVASADHAAGQARWYRAWHVVSRRPWLLLVVLAAISTLLLPLMEVEAVGQRVTYGQKIFPAAWIAALSRSDWIPVLVALGFVTGFVHYQLDRAVFRFSDPAVRRAAHTLWPDRD